MPDMTPVSSSTIDSIGYDEESKTLTVRFLRSGAVYEYDDMPAELHEELLHSPSPGSVLRQYTGRRVA